VRATPRRDWHLAIGCAAVTLGLLSGCVTSTDTTAADERVEPPRADDDRGGVGAPAAHGGACDLPTEVGSFELVPGRDERLVPVGVPIACEEHYLYQGDPWSDHLPDGETELGGPAQAQ
jgi:hypothetical protein